MNTALWWVRRDLRLGDNQALAEALLRARHVLPVFVLDPGLLSSPWAGEKRLGFLLAALRSLDADLRARGSYLVLRRGKPEEVLSELVQETGAERIFAEEDYSPYARQRDGRIAQSLPLSLIDGLTVHPPYTVMKTDGTPYTIFTPFSRAWRSLPFPGRPFEPPREIPTPAGIPGESIPDAPQHELADLFPVSEVDAFRRLEQFSKDAIFQYGEYRNRMDLDGTSSLSPYLRFGMLSARQAAWAVREAEFFAPDPTSRQGAEAWLNELIWREFYISILYHFPHVRRESFRAELRNIPWRNDRTEFDSWKEGCTGYPVVDAAMRQLSQSGWMHNRARMIAASFLVKDLMIDWRWGEKHFMQRLLDGDPAANNGGWQWTAGTGTDAAPYFRVFNPLLQGKKFDPLGAYVKRYVPELADVPDEFIHEPWKMSMEQQGQFCCMIGVDYPAPIVDHAVARARVLDAYKVKEIV
jgi:deoxyribodipyrimidine photo-lyase